MKCIYIFLIISLLTLSCETGKDTDYKSTGLMVFDPFPLEVPEQNALMTQWEKKEVFDSRMIDDFESDKSWQVTGIGEMSYTEDRAHSGGRSLRFRTSLRDEEFYRQNRSEWDSFNGSQGGHTFLELSFDEPQDWSAFNRISFWIYVHPTSMPTYCISLNMVCQDAIHTATDYNGASHFVQDLKTGEWNHVMFEIPHLQRDKVIRFTINQTLRGHNPEEEGIVTYDIDQLEIQRVETDMFEGWEVEKGKFSYNHIGYLPEAPKIALAGFDAGDAFQVLDKDDKVVYSGSIRREDNEQGMFRLLDFSNLRESGDYRLRYGTQMSNPFPINENVWVSPLFKAMNFFFSQRCGFHVPGVHLACHKDWQGFYGEIRKIINGGWHDAGDLSQGSWRTAMSTLAMMMNLERIKDQPELDELSNRIREEIAWGLEWLLKTRFGDGYHMSFSVMRIYTDNEVGTIDDVVTPARNVPWENFLAAAVQSKAGRLLASTHPDLARQSRTAALEDWEAGMNSRQTWEVADYREAAWGATSSIFLAEMTGDDRYLDHAVMFGDLLVECQEQEFKDGIPITGYFYTTSERVSVIHNHHGAFEEAPLIALSTLCKTLPEHEHWIDWYSAAVLHSEYFMKRGSRIAAPYDLLPNSVWHKSEILAENDENRREDMMRQFLEGTLLKDDYVLRTFPIYYNSLFHGNTNIHMSSTWALAEASRLRHDAEGMKLTGKQFQWLFGGNPFSQSLMYGEGYDFPPHFAYCLKDLVGALPVGMDCHSGDDPHWSATNKATYKEIWVEPVNRFMGALSIYLSYQQADPDHSNGQEEAQVNLKAGLSATLSGKVLVQVTSNRDLDLMVRPFNVEVSNDGQEIVLDTGNNHEMQLEMDILEPGKPYVLVLADVDNPEKWWEMTGALVRPIVP
jgi:hypothetical protein